MNTALVVIGIVGVVVIAAVLIHVSRDRIERRSRGRGEVFLFNAGAKHRREL
jgi:hypothetical protein